MKLGAFSISLAVDDLSVSREFYGKLGFEPVAGDGETYQILRNGTTVLGLFQGMFEENLLTFNPGWDQHQAELHDFDDVRDIRTALEQVGVMAVDGDTGASEQGPAHFVIVDPDGNTILFDQHR